MVDISPGNSFSRVRASGRKAFSVVKKWREETVKSVGAARLKAVQMLLTTLPLSNLRRPARPSPSLSFFHVPFFLFFPFRRHLLPRENSTIGRAAFEDAQSQSGPLGLELLHRPNTLCEDGQHRLDQPRRLRSALPDSFRPNWVRDARWRGRRRRRRRRHVFPHHRQIAS